MELLLIRAMIRLNYVPDQLGKTLLFPASKSGSDIHVMDTLLPKQPIRPVLGLECIAKRIECVITFYFNDAGFELDLLDGTSGESTALSAAAASCLVAEDAFYSGKLFIALDCDKDNAFVRVPFWQVALGYQYLGVPLQLIDFMENLQIRTYSMNTAYGPTPFVPSVQGTCQGSVLGVLHYAVANYPIQLHYMQTGDQYVTGGTGLVTGVTTSLTIYVDDERHYFASPAALLERLHLMERFNACTGAKLNPSKTSICYALANDPDIQHMEAPTLPDARCQRRPVSILSPSDPVKRLGTHSSLNGRCLGTARSVLSKITSFTAAVGKRLIPFSQMKYLINSCRGGMRLC